MKQTIQNNTARDEKQQFHKIDTQKNFLMSTQNLSYEIKI